MAQADKRDSTNNPARVAVTAAGVISPLGFGLAETLESLRSARDCMTPVMRFSVAAMPVQNCGPGFRLASAWRATRKYLVRNACIARRT